MSTPPPNDLRAAAAAAHARTNQQSESQPALDEELLLDGQEEVFSRTEVERGAIEHHTLEEDRHITPVDPDEAMASNFQAAFNPRP